MNKINKIIEDFENNTGHTVLYVTISGSKLYGTNSESSDTDYKGIFLPSKESVLLKTDKDTYSENTNNSKEKNSSEDIDFTLHSVYQFFNLLKKSETGSVDMLFSMFREDTIVYENKYFTNLMKNNYKSFLNKDMKAFVGYALGQAKRFGIKGARYDELRNFVQYFESIPIKPQENLKLGTVFDIIEQELETKQYKYIKTLMAPGPRSNRVQPDIKYLVVLGKMFSGDITFDYFLDKINEQFNQFGNRTKTIADTESKTDFKALSHSLRIMKEVFELVETGFIQFPLTYADEIKQVKSGNCNVEEVIDNIQNNLDSIDYKLETSHLPNKADEKLINELLLSFYL